MNQFAGGASKWDDPNYDPTKQEIETDVPLHIAAFKGELGEVKKLLADGADVNEATETGWTGLMWAVMPSVDCASVGGLRELDLLQNSLSLTMTEQQW